MTRPLLLILCLLAAGCGADEPAPVSAKNDTRRHHGQGLPLPTADDPRPAGPPAGRRSTNRGRLAHTFRVERKDAIVAKISSLLPGDRDSTTFKVRKGEYRFFCALSNHEELGMYGTLVVK